MCPHSKGFGAHPELLSSSHRAEAAVTATLQCAFKSRPPRPSVADIRSLSRGGGMLTPGWRCVERPQRDNGHWTPKFRWFILPETEVSLLLVAAKAPYGIGFSIPVWGNESCIICIVCIVCIVYESSNGLSWWKISKTFYCPIGLSITIHSCLKSQQVHREEVPRVTLGEVCYDFRKRHEFLNSYMNRPGESVWSRSRFLRVRDNSVRNKIRSNWVYQYGSIEQRFWVYIAAERC